MADLLFYTKRGCELCDRLKAMILDEIGDNDRPGLRLVEIDIERDPGLIEQFRYRVPVVVLSPPDEVILEGRPEAAEVAKALDAVGDE